MSVGPDIMTQAVEPQGGFNIACDGFCREGVVVVGVSLPSALVKVQAMLEGMGAQQRLLGRGHWGLWKGKSMGRMPACSGS